MRYPAVAGKFYQGEEGKLRKQVEACYKHVLGPGPMVMPNKDGPRKIRGLVVPHAGFMYSGPVAAHAYKALAEDGWPEAFVIIGPNHTGFGSSVCATEHDFQTPLGTVKIERHILELLESGGIPNEIGAHRYEHSVEVQLPFLQLLGEVNFVPLVMMSQDYDTAKKVGGVIKQAIRGRDVVVIASTDFSHYVPPDVAKKGDALAVDRIESADAKGLFDLVRRTGLSMCGYGPVMTMLEATGATSAKLLAYHTSGDVHPMNEVVGYAAMKVED